MIKKTLVFISILICLVTLLVIPASAEIIDLSVLNANDSRSAAVQEDPELCEYMYSKYSLYLELYDPLTNQIIYNEIYFSTKQTELCKNPVPGKDGVFMSDYQFETYWVPKVIDNTETNGWTISKNYQSFVEPHYGINKRLIEVFGNDTQIQYLLEEEYGFQHQKEDVFKKYQIDIGKEVVTVYLDTSLTSEQENVLKTDDIMNTSTVYIMLAIVIIAVIGCATFFILMKAKKLIYKNASYY